MFLLAKRWRKKKKKKWHFRRRSFARTTFFNPCMHAMHAPIAIVRMGTEEVEGENRSRPDGQTDRQTERVKESKEKQASPLDAVYVRTLSKEDAGWIIYT